MKKILAVVLALLMVAFAFAACTKTEVASNDNETNTEASSNDSEANTEAAAPVKTVESGKLYMATNAAFPPYEMTKDDGSGYEGIDVEIATAIAGKLGLELVVDDMDFTSVVTSVQTGKDDIAMAGLTRKRREKEEHRLHHQLR